MKQTFIATLALLLFTLVNYAQVRHHPVVVPMPNSRLESQSKYKDYGIHVFETDEGGIKVQKALEGKFWYLKYQILEKETNTPAYNISTKEIKDYYRQLANANQGKVLSENVFSISFNLKVKGLGEIWVNLFAWGEGEYALNIIQPETEIKDVVFTSSEIKNALTGPGRIIIEGLVFDVGKASLKLNSLEALSEVATLLLESPEMIVEIQGHTDDQGNEKTNEALSKDRAEAVKNFLVLFGVKESRMTTKGYGETQPIAPNNTEEGRARNRRVELHRK